MRISDWSSDVCSSDLLQVARRRHAVGDDGRFQRHDGPPSSERIAHLWQNAQAVFHGITRRSSACGDSAGLTLSAQATVSCAARSEEHTSELQSLMRIPYAVFCLKKKNRT